MDPDDTTGPPPATLFEPTIAKLPSTMVNTGPPSSTGTTTPGQPYPASTVPKLGRLLGTTMWIGVRNRKIRPFTCLIYVFICTHDLYMVYLYINDACHIMPPHSTSVEVQNAPSPKETPGTCQSHPTPHTLAVTTVIVTTFISQLVSLK